MEFTVGIVTLGRTKQLEAVLESLSQQTRFPEEIIIIDDSNDPAPGDVIYKNRENNFHYKTDLIYIHRPNGSKMSDARNAIIEMAKGDIICYIDDDVECPPDWLAEIEKTYINYPSANSVGGPALRVNKSGNLDINLLYEHKNQNTLNKYGEVTGKSDRWVPPDICKTHHLRGANMTFKTSTLRKFDGFNTEYEGPELYEDKDIFARLWKQDLLILYNPNAYVYHYEEFSGVSNLEPEDWYWRCRNSIVFKKEVFPRMFWLSLIRVLFYKTDWPAPVWKQIGAYMVDNEERHWACIRGYIDGLRQTIR